MRAFWIVILFCLASPVAFAQTQLSRPAANVLGINTAGSERMRVDATGNVGIGTTNPAVKLDVRGVTWIREPGATANTNPPDYAGGGQDYISLMFGPNDSTPNTARAGLGFRARTSSQAAGAAIVNIPSGTNASSLTFWTNPDGSFTSLSERMRITGAGNIGVGTTNPAQMLSVAGTIQSTSGGFMFPDGSVQTTSANGFGTNNSIVSGWPDVIMCTWTSPAWGTGPFYLRYMPYTDGRYWYRSSYSGGDYDIIFNADGTQFSTGATTNCSTKSIATLYSEGRAFNIAKGPVAQWLQSGSNAYYNAGNVGIGTTAPSFKLEVKDGAVRIDNSVGTDADLRFANNASTGGKITYSTQDMRFFTAGAQRAVIAASGNVGIGTTTPTGALDVSSTTGAFVPPRMTTAERDALVSPPNGSVIYNSTTGQMNMRENGTWTAGGRTNCPTGFSLIGTPGERDAFCISTAEETSATWINAATACYNKTPKSRLCETGEWLSACISGTPTNMTGNYEWIAEVDGSGDSMQMGNTDCSTNRFTNLTASAVYRCCLK